LSGTLDGYMLAMTDQYNGARRPIPHRYRSESEQTAVGYEYAISGNEKRMTELAMNGPLVELLPFGPVEVQVPSDPLASRIVRLTAGGVASLGGFDVERIEDIQMAVSEVFVALLEHGSGDPIELQFVVDHRSFTVRGSTINPAFDTHDTDLDLCRTVLAAVSSEHGIERVDDHAQIWAVVEHTSA
jgi:hypothetical protein